MIRFSKKQLDNLAKEKLSEIKKKYSHDRKHQIKLIGWAICVCNAFPITLQMELHYENMGHCLIVFDLSMMKGDPCKKLN